MVTSKHLGFVGLAALLLSVILVYFVRSKYSYQTTTVVIKNTTIYVEVAKTETQRAKGLMFRKHLDSDKGMLFVFPKEARHAFWMVNTKIPLDIIWLDSSKKIIYLSKNTPSCTQTGRLQSLCKIYRPDSKAKYVLEVNAGFADNYNIAVGDHAEFNL